MARTIPGAGLLITKPGTVRSRAWELFLKTIENAVLTGVVEFKARTSILDGILNAKQLAGAGISISTQDKTVYPVLVLAPIL